VIKCCIFDLDGTVLDTIETITHYVNVTLEKHGLEKISCDECKYFAGNGAKVLIRRTLASKGISDDGVYEAVYKDYMEAYDSEPLYLTKSFSGISEQLAELKHRGIKIAILSNKPDYPVKQNVKHFFDGLVDLAEGGKEGVRLKPSPDAAQAICDKLSVSADETAFIGDTSTDIETGKNLKAGLCVGVLWGFREREELLSAGADAIVSTPEEMLNAILNKN
jgi:phosphoglycolate phosphatase